MSLYDFVMFCSTVAEAFMAFMFFEALLRHRAKARPWMYVLSFGGLVILNGLCNHFFLHSIQNAIGMIVAAWLVSFVYAGTMTRRVLAAILGLLVAGLCELLVFYMMTNVFGISAKAVVEEEQYQILGIIASKFLAMAVSNGFRVKWKKSQLNVSSTYWVLFVVLFSTALLSSGLIFIMTYTLNNPRFNIWAGMSCVGLTVGTFFALYLYEHLSKQSEAIRVQEQREQQLKAQLTHVEELTIKQHQLRRFRHDIANQLTGLQGYFDRADYAKGEQYLKTLTKQFDDMRVEFDTGNSAFDTILSTKEALAEKKGIRFQKDVRIPANLAIAPSDACVIFGNILDNAIEACERVTNGEKWISFSLVQQEHVILCKVANAAPERGTVVLKTSKADKENHGYGLMNIRQALEKYDSTPTITHKDGKFTLRFSIFLK